MNTEHVLKGDMLTYDLLTEKLFLSHKYNLLISVVTKNVHKEVNFPNCKENKASFLNFALLCALKCKQQASKMFFRP